MGMVVIKPNNSVSKLKTTKTEFLRCTQWLPKLHKKPINQDLLLILVL